MTAEIVRRDTEGVTGHGRGRLPTGGRTAVIGSLAVLGFVAALAGIFGWVGSWVVGLGVVIAALGLGWRIWSDVLVPYRAEQEAANKDRAHDEAVEIHFHRDDGATRVGVTNRGTHEIHAIEVVGIPEGGDLDPMLVGPAFHGYSSGDVGVTTMPGGDLYVRIERLSPGRGLGIGAFAEPRTSVTRIKFDVSWIDHGGLRRAETGVGDLADENGIVALVPRPR